MRSFIQFLIIFLMVCRLCFTTSAADEIENPLSGGSQSDNSAQANTPTFPGLRINLEEWCVDVDARICLEEGMLELIACTQGTKEHESIVAIDSKARDIHTALLLLNAKAGSPAHSKPVDGDEKKWIPIPPSGTPVNVFLVLKNESSGKLVEKPIKDFIVNEGGETFTTHSFLFAGSVLHRKDNNGPGEYLADRYGNVISITTFGDELLCLPDIRSHANHELNWQIASDKLPKLGTQVTMRLRPQTKQKHQMVESSKKPNIVIILADDLGWGDVGYHGGTIDTPNIDQLAEEGIQLENFHVAPLCSPTRAGLMTGRWPIRYGMGESVITPWRNWGLPETERTIADLLGTAGYKRRGIVGKWHLGHYKRALQPLQRGFTSFYGHYNGAFDYFTHIREKQLDWHRNDATSFDEGYSTNLIGSEAVRFIQEAGKDDKAPFFLYVPFNAPHTPFQAKEDDISKYAEKAKSKKHAIYAAMVDSMDQAIGDILDALDSNGLSDNTFVLFFSDNGGISTPASNGSWRGFKGSVYEGGIRVPAIVRWPAGLEGRRIIQDLMGYIDIYPTLKTLTGTAGSDPNPIDGINLIPILRGEKKAPKRDWFSYIEQGTPSKLALTHEPWKLVVTKGDVSQADPNHPSGPPMIELFNLKKDPIEQDNLVEKESDRTAIMLKRLQAHFQLKIDGIPHFREGSETFVAPKNWLIED